MDTPKRKLSRREKAARASARATKLKAAKMRTPRELSEILGIGINPGLCRARPRGSPRCRSFWHALVDSRSGDRAARQRRAPERGLKKNAPATNRGVCISGFLERTLGATGSQVTSRKPSPWGSRPLRSAKLSPKGLR